jgi:hypothetical protein
MDFKKCNYYKELLGIMNGSSMTALVYFVFRCESQLGRLGEEQHLYVNERCLVGVYSGQCEPQTSDT